MQKPAHGVRVRLHLQWRNTHRGFVFLEFAPAEGRRHPARSRGPLAVLAGGVPSGRSGDSTVLVSRTPVLCVCSLPAPPVAAQAPGETPGRGCTVPQLSTVGVDCHHVCDSTDSRCGTCGGLCNEFPFRRLHPLCHPCCASIVGWVIAHLTPDRFLGNFRDYKIVATPDFTHTVGCTLSFRVERHLVCEKRSPFIFSLRKKFVKLVHCGINRRNIEPVPPGLRTPLLRPTQKCLRDFSFFCTFSRLCDFLTASAKKIFFLTLALRK